MNVKDVSYDLVVVGCGFSGALIAHLAAKRLKKRVLILERRNHIAGNRFGNRDCSTKIRTAFFPHKQCSGL